MKRTDGVMGLRRGAIRFWPLVMVFYFTVSGGPFGLEESVRESGPVFALLLVAIVPFVWALPIALMSCELTSAIPAEGGFYAWVKRGLGPFWGFQCAWWTWLTSFAEVAVYAHLSAGYTAALLATRVGWHIFDHDSVRWLLALSIIWTCAWLNIRGAKTVGCNSIVLSAVLLVPLLAMVTVGIIDIASGNPAASTSWLHDSWTSDWKTSIGAGLFIVMWNYYGFDTPSAVTEEMDHPQRNYLRATVLSLLLIASVYLLTLFVGLCYQPDASKWNDDSFPAIAALAGGSTIGLAVFVAAIASQVGLFNACLMSYSRMPFVLANDGFLPSAATRTHPKYGTPTVAIIISALVYSILSYQEFDFLISLSVITYSAALLLEFVSLCALRIKEPNLLRPFRIPGGWPVLSLVCASPAALIVGAVLNEQLSDLVVPLCALASGPLLYFPLSRCAESWGTPSSG